MNRTINRSYAFTSDNVVNAGYDYATRTLQLQFRDGSVYEYYDRAPVVWRDYQAAGSKGSFVCHRLTPAGKYRKVRGGIHFGATSHVTSNKFGAPRPMPRRDERRYF